MAKKTTYTNCTICEQVCGLEVVSDGDQILSIAPDKKHPHWRDFCIKGARADRLRSHPSRIRQPMMRVGDKYQAVSYDVAVQGIGDKLRQIKAQHGPNAIAGYLGSPGGFNPGNGIFYSALLKALGSNNTFSTGSVDQNAFHVAAELMYGSPWLGLVTDIDQCDFILLIGSNPAVSAMNWMGSQTDGWNRVKAMVARGGELVMVDPKKTESTREATQHLMPPVETDWALLLMLLKHIFDKGLEDKKACAEFTGVDDLRRLLDTCDYDDLSKRCEIDVKTATDLAERFARAGSAACMARTGPAQGRNGALGEWLSHTLNAVTGQLGKRGGRFYNSTMTDVPSLMDVDPAIDTQSRVRKISSVAGGRTLAELADEIETPGPGQIRAFFMNSGNPVISAANGLRLDRALAKLDLLVSVDLFQRDSHRHAHWLIPGTHFLERTQLMLMISCYVPDGFAQKTRQVVPPPPTVRYEWEFFRDLAAYLDLPLFPGGFNPTPDDLFKASVAMGESPFSYEELSDAQHGLQRDVNPRKSLKDVLRTPDRRVNVAPRPLVEMAEMRLAEPAVRPDRAAWPYQLITKRSLAMMNSYLTETVAADMVNKPGDTVEINRADAARDGIKNGDTVTVRSPCASTQSRAVVSDDVRPGVAVMPHGWGTHLYDPVTGTVTEGGGVNRNLLISDAEVDPLTGVPRLNGQPVAIERV
jgi:formate dehydrogenase